MVEQIDLMKTTPGNVEDTKQMIKVIKVRDMQTLSNVQKLRDMQKLRLVKTWRCVKT